MRNESENAEQRIGARLDAKDPVYFSDVTGWGSLCRGALQNRSSGGVQILTDTPQTPGTRIEIEFLPTPENGQGETIISKGEIQYIKSHPSGGYLLGIRTLFDTKPTAQPKIRAPRYRASMLAPIRDRARIEKPRAASSVAPPRKIARSHKLLAAASILIIAVLPFLFRSAPDAPPRIYLPKGINSSSSFGTITLPKSDTTDHFYASYSRIRPSPDVELEILDPVPVQTQIREDSFLFAAQSAEKSDYSHVKQEHTPTPVEQLAGTLEKARAAVQNGDRLAALYLTRNAASDLDALPGPWRDILHEFRSTLTNAPGKIPALPVFDSWLPLNSPLDSFPSSTTIGTLPANAPVVVYIDKDTFNLARHPQRRAALAISRRSRRAGFHSGRRFYPRHENHEPRPVPQWQPRPRWIAGQPAW